MQRLELWSLRWRLRGDRTAFYPWVRCPRCWRAYGSRVVDDDYDIPVRCDRDGTWWTIPRGH